MENLRCLRQQIKRDIRNNYDIFLRNTQNSILNDPKTFWSFVNSKKRTTSIPGVVVHEDQEFSSSQAIVNVFAQFFAGVYVKHVCEDVCVSKDVSKQCEFCKLSCCPSLEYDLKDCGGVNMMHNFKIDEDMIVRAGKKLKSNSVSGPDNIPAFIVVDCIRSFAAPLARIFNLIALKSEYPVVWKQSRVCPIFKSGDKGCVKNYRPIAILSNFAKLYESMLSNIIYSHVNNMIMPEQHGFVKGKSTATNLCEFTNFISQELDKGNEVDVIYTDLSKAFDKVHHCILLKKLRNFGLCDGLVSLVQSVITKRVQYVEYKGFVSGSFCAHSGVAQGSNLGPLLFILFFNDVLDYISSHAYLYADDKKIAKVINSYDDCLELQQDLDNFIYWCKRNCLEVNKDKCRVLKFSRKKNHIYFYYNING